MRRPHPLANDAERGRPAVAERQGLLVWLLLAPFLLWLVALVVLPTVILVAQSFGRRGALGGVVAEPTLTNYVAALDPTYLRILLRSAALGGLTTLLCLLLGYPTAYFIARQAGRWRDALLVAVMIPFWTSFLIRTYAWVTILKTEGLLNGVLFQLGLITTPWEMLYTPGAVVVGLVYTFLPFMILPIYASAEKLEGDLLEASFDLGAGPWQTFARVVLPLTSPGIWAGIALVFAPSLGLYAVNDLLGGGRVDMIGNVIENQFRGTGRNWPFGAALSVLLLVAFFVTYWLAVGTKASAGRASAARSTLGATKLGAGGL